MSDFISSFNKHFYHYKTMIINFPHITDPKYISHNFELISIQKNYYSEIIYSLSKLLNNNLEDFKIEQLKKSLVANSIFTLPNNIFLNKNKYPYEGPNNLQSYVVWCFNGKFTNEYIENLLLSYNIINKELHDYIIFQNPTVIKTVKSINHCHLLIRKKNNFLISNFDNQKFIKIKKIVCVVRHGPREPLVFLPKLDNSYWKNKLNYQKQVHAAVLTDVGKIYSRLAGEEFFNGYKEFFNGYKEFFNGYKEFFNGYKEFFNGYKESFNLDRGSIYIASSDFERTKSTTKYFLSSLNLDYEINILDVLSLDKDNLDLYLRLEKSVELDFEDNFLEKFNNKIFNIFGYKIKNNHDYLSIHSVISIYKVHKYPLPESWTNNLDTTLKIITNIYYNKLFTINLSKLLVKNLINKIKEILNNDSIKFSFLCSHDTILMALLRYFQPDKSYFLPDFCSQIRFELWYNNLLRIYYDGIIIYESKN
jgi:hypothetical protein